MDIPEPSPVKYSMSEKDRSCKAESAACSNCENYSRKCWKNVHTGPHWSAIYQKSLSLLSLSFSGCIASLPPVILIFSMSLSRWNWLLHRTLSALLWRMRCNTFRSVLWNASCSIWWQWHWVTFRPIVASKVQNLASRGFQRSRRRIRDSMAHPDQLLDQSHPWPCRCAEGVATRTWYTNCTSSKWLNQSTARLVKKLPLFKRDSRPPTTWLGKATASQTMMWRVKDVVVSNGIIECHIKKLKIEMGCWTLNCLRHHIWLDVSTLNKRLFTTKQRWFMLILICEASQIFVWRNKAFIFFQKSDILFIAKLLRSQCIVFCRCHPGVSQKTFSVAVPNELKPISNCCFVHCIQIENSCLTQLPWWKNILPFWVVSGLYFLWKTPIVFPVPPGVFISGK